jgi:hypothetical protein
LVGIHVSGGCEYIPLGIEERTDLATKEGHSGAGRSGELTASLGQDRQEGGWWSDASEIEQSTKPASQHRLLEKEEVIGETLGLSAVKMGPSFEDHALAAAGVGLHEGVEQSLFEISHT